MWEFFKKHCGKIGILGTIICVVSVVGAIVAAPFVAVPVLATLGAVAAVSGIGAAMAGATFVNQKDEEKQIAQQKQSQAEYKADIAKLEQQMPLKPANDPEMQAVKARLDNHDEDHKKLKDTVEANQKHTDIAFQGVNRQLRSLREDASQIRP